MLFSDSESEEGIPSDSDTSENEDANLLKEFNIKPCHVVLHRIDTNQLQWKTHNEGDITEQAGQDFEEMLTQVNFLFLEFNFFIAYRGYIFISIYFLLHMSNTCKLQFTPIFKVFHVLSCLSYLLPFRSS